MKEHDVCLYCFTPSKVNLKETPTGLLFFKDKDKESAPPGKTQESIK